MLEGLNSVPWDDLQHAYGSAEDVPALLRALADSEDVIGELFGNIWHQGTVYEASSYAVPFLVELTAEPTVAARGDILGLLGALADGHSFLAGHAQPELGSIGQRLRQQPDYEQKLAAELEHVRRTRDAVFDHHQAFERLLEDPAPMVRAGAAYVLSRFPEHVADFAPFVRQAAQHERAPLARAGMLWCLGCLRDASPETAAMLDAIVRCPDPRQAFAAATALHRIAGQPPPAAAQLYRQLAAATWFAEEFLTGVPWDFNADPPVEELIEDVEPDAPAATKMLLDFLSCASDESEVYSSVMHDLVELNFPQGKWWLRRQLTDVQKQVLSCLADTQAVWSDTPVRLWNAAGKDLRRSNPTATDIAKLRAEMRQLASGTAPAPTGPARAKRNWLGRLFGRP